MSSKAIEATEEIIRNIENRIKELVESSSKLYLCTDGIFGDYSAFDGCLEKSKFEEKNGNDSIYIETNEIIIYRKQNKIRELNYKKKEEIDHE